MSDQTKDITFADVPADELRAMLQDKIAELNAANEEIIKIKSRALKVHEENTMLQHSPEYAKQAGEMKYQLEVARHFIKSGAFPNQTPEQLYVKIKAGKEMGLSESASVNGLYFVNGKLEPYGKDMVSLLTSKGYRVEYIDETKDRVTVKVTDLNNPDRVYTEVAAAADPIIQRSKAAKISLRNKLRFHGVRLVLNFQLPHLITGLPDLFENDALTATKDNQGNTMVMVSDSDVLALIENAASIEQLEGVVEEHRTTITKDINLTSALGAARKKFENDQ